MSAENTNQRASTIAQLVEAGNSTTNKTGNVEPAKTAKSVETRLTGNDKNKVNVLDRLIAANMLVPGSSLGREIQDEYRRIKRPLVSNAVGRHKTMVDRGNLILVTSAVPGEGKTYNSVNLALSIAAEKDNTVLLVDCDVVQQGVSRMFGLDKRPGLVDVMENDDLSIGDVLLETDIPNLRVVSAGKQNEYVTELLTSQRVGNIVNEMTSRYSDRIIIFDGPPLLPAPQTQILAGMVGQVVLVVEAGKTPQSLVEEALELIPKEQAIGLVINKNQGFSSRNSNHYGYYGSDDDHLKDNDTPK